MTLRSGFVAWVSYFLARSLAPPDPQIVLCTPLCIPVFQHAVTTNEGFLRSVFVAWVSVRWRRGGHRQQLEIGLRRAEAEAVECDLGALESESWKECGSWERVHPKSHPTDDGQLPCCLPRSIVVFHVLFVLTHFLHWMVRFRLIICAAGRC
jgi:hypothetical protein